MLNKQKQQYEKRIKELEEEVKRWQYIAGRVSTKLETLKDEMYGVSVELREMGGDYSKAGEILCKNLMALQLRGFAKDALEDSIERAREAGVPEEKIIHNFEEGERFFLGD